MTIEEATQEMEQQTNVLLRMQNSIPRIEQRIAFLNGYIARAQENPSPGAEDQESKKEGE